MWRRAHQFFLLFVLSIIKNFKKIENSFSNKIPPFYHTILREGGAPIKTLFLFGWVWQNFEVRLVMTGCGSQVAEGAIDGAVIGATVGSVIGLVDAALVLLNTEGRVDILSRLLTGIVQGGLLGLILGAVFSLAKYCV